MLFTIASGGTVSNELTIDGLGPVTLTCNTGWNAANYAVPYLQSSAGGIAPGPLHKADGSGAFATVFSGTGVWSASLPYAFQGNGVRVWRLQTAAAVDRTVVVDASFSGSVTATWSTTAIASGQTVSAAAVSPASGSYLLASGFDMPANLWTMQTLVGSTWSTVNVTSGVAYAISNGTGCFPHGVVTGLSLQSGTQFRFVVSSATEKPATVRYSVR